MGLDRCEVGGQSCSGKADDKPFFRAERTAKGNVGRDGNAILGRSVGLEVSKQDADLCEE